MKFLEHLLQEGIVKPKRKAAGLNSRETQQLIDLLAKAIYAETLNNWMHSSAATPYTFWESEPSNWDTPAHVGELAAEKAEEWIRNYHEDVETPR